MDFQHWIHLSETDFHRLLKRRIAETGEIGDVFPLMVGHNLPHHLLRKLWPERWTRFAENPGWIAFAAAETGWRGRVENIDSRIRSDAKGQVLHFKKSHVITSDVMLILAKCDQDLALAFVPRSESQNWRTRGEPGVQMRSSDGALFDHHHVEGEQRLARDDFIRIDKKTYARFGIQLPRRELTSLAVIALGLLEHHGVNFASDLNRIHERESRVLKSRERERIGRADADAAEEILNFFYAKIQEADIRPHPFWERVRELMTGRPKN